jgi:competence protein ComEA
VDRFGEWRPIEAAATDDGNEPESKTSPAKTVEPARPEANVISVRLVGLLAAAVLAVGGAVIWFGGAAAQPSLSVSGAAGFVSLSSSEPLASNVPGLPTGLPELVVDVEGAVVRPGVHHLPAGSRVGDAVAAAGGYSPRVDIAAAATTLNLAAPLADGSKVHVPARGEAALANPALPADPSAAGSSGTGGLIDLNAAGAEDLETLPGIGPVTAAKIIDARAVAPFTTVDDLVTREVVGAATFEKIRDLISVGP